ncbi:relaxase/mobilization nuclease domain-containing protein [Oceaniradius stylonematis]|uniref:relaxase/mobilization nuclease domain-containing protein n=1 Tax=Oceaniradius stylonematis TaxID=2184161 RepID=UPI003C7C4CC2
MSDRDNDLHIRPGRIRNRGTSSRKAQSFVGQVMGAARKAGHTGYKLGGSKGRARGSQFGRGRFAGAAHGLSRTQRRVVVKARVVRHRGARFRSAPLAKHIAYLKREGVTRDGREAGMFSADADSVDDRAFAGRCEEDRHHFRFIVSPEDADRLDDLRAFTRDLMKQAERDLGTRLDWIGVDHWNTDNPHVHVLVRGRAENGKDLVISRDYISRGLRGHAEKLVELELGPRNEREIAAGLQAEVTAERWTGLDRALQGLADDGAGVADLRPGSPEPRDPELRSLLIGRAQTLERLGLADRLDPAVWSLKPGAEQTLRDLAERGDIIKTMHRAMASGPSRAQTDFAIEAAPDTPVLGRLVERGLHDELRGESYAVIDAVDGRVHHLRFHDLDAAGDTPEGGIVETRVWRSGDSDRQRMALVGRSDLNLENQIGANGATWLDRLQLARDHAPLSMDGFGAEVREALDRRGDHLVAEGLATRNGRRITFARDLLKTLRDRELDATAAKIVAETGLPRRKPAEGERIAGTYRQRLDLASGRFAMIDDGLGFELVPWKPQLERHLSQSVSGTMTPGGGIDWSLGRKRGLSL